MPKGVYKRTEEHRRKLREGHLGKPLSEEHKKKLREYFLGKPLSEEHKKKIGLGLRGHKVSEESKKKLSETRKRLFREGKCKLSMLGKHHSEETKQKIGLANKKHIPWNKGIPRSEKTKRKLSEINKGRKLTEKHKKKLSISHLGKYPSKETIRKMQIARLNQKFPLKDSSIELKLQEELKKRGIKFETHKNIENIAQPDIFIEPNICIFADGCYWHGCELCYDKNKMSNWILAKKERDLIITSRLKQKNYVVLRFWEHEINNNLENCIRKIFNGVEFEVIRREEPVME